MFTVYNEYNASLKDANFITNVLLPQYRYIEQNFVQLCGKNGMVPM
jgi:hypothetical protein